MRRGGSTKPALPWLEKLLFLAFALVCIEGAAAFGDLVWVKTSSSLAASRARCRAGWGPLHLGVHRRSQAVV
ncbi:MAG: hypothetical protein IPK07_23850 [Deltaproteobacteria bacterium]|nr:hypothetical protein [Deltaproteobacteria bacterium]